MAEKKKKPYEIGELDQYLFGQGNHYEIYEKLGAHLVQNGADLRAVQEMMGHADISTTQLYMDMNVRRVREIYAKAHPRR